MTVKERQRSGGRSEQVRLAVGRAVLELLAEQRIAFTTVEVAERAGVNRRTIYRWWPTHDLLLAEALEQHARDIEVPDTGSLPGDLRAFAQRVAVFAAEPVDLTITRIMVSGLHPEFNQAILDHFAPVMAGWYAMLEGAVRRGEASDHHLPVTVINALVAPLFLAPLTSGEAMSSERVDQVVDLILDAVGADRG